MRFLIMAAVLVVAGSACGQLVVFDNSHGPGDELYDSFKSHLEVWGYTVEARTGPVVDNGDADVIVILPLDAYTGDGDPYTAQEAAWLKDFVDGGGGLFVGQAPNYEFQARLAELMDEFGIALGVAISNPAFYFEFAALPLFDGVWMMGSEFSYCFSLDIGAPSSPVASDEHHDYIAAYTPPGRQDGAAVWVSHYRMTAAPELYEYDNLRFLANAFAWLTDGVHVSNEDATWGEVKELYR